MVGFENEIKKRKSNFYQRNIGNAVNLFGRGITFSGDLVCYNESQNMVVLKNYIERRYFPDGTSKFWENSGELEFNVSRELNKSVTTRGDRLGRILNYNQDLKIQELEQKEKLKKLIRIKK
jgi:hypothetical protein